jgi:ribose transport system substrate-binding protein
MQLINKSTRACRHGVLVAAIASVSAIMLAACSSSGGTSPSSSSSSTGSATSSQASTAQAAANNYSQPVSSYSMPTTQITDLSKLKGKTVYYIPGSEQVPEFEITGDAFTAALKTAGMHVVICNGGFNPTDTSACVQQATSAGAAGIVLDGEPYQMVQNALDTAKSKGIAIIIADQVPDPALEVTDKVDYLLGASVTMHQALVDWIIGNSDGKANILINEDTDSPSTLAWIQDYALPELKSDCSGCSYTINKISTANISMVPSSTSSALISNPSTKYVYSEFDSFLQSTQSGVQQAGYTNKVEGVSTTALLSGLRLIASKNYLYADAGDDFPYQGWATADEMFRMLLGMATPTEDIPMRLFTRDNVSSVALTETAQDDGAWFGPTDFPAQWEKLWGEG